jgi:hypothetical protein
MKTITNILILMLSIHSTNFQYLFLILIKQEIQTLLIKTFFKQSNNSVIMKRISSKQKSYYSVQHLLKSIKFSLQSIFIHLTYKIFILKKFKIIIVRKKYSQKVIFTNLLRAMPSKRSIKL